MYVYSDTYVKKEDIPLNISPKVEGFYSRAKKKKYLDEDLIKCFGINGVLFKAKKVIGNSILRINNYIKYIAGNLNEYVWPNGLCLYFNNTTIIEIDPYNKSILVYEVEKFPCTWSYIFWRDLLSITSISLR